MTDSDKVFFIFFKCLLVSLFQFDISVVLEHGSQEGGRRFEERERKAPNIRDMNFLRRREFFSIEERKKRKVVVTRLSVYY